MTRLATVLVALLAVGCIDTSSPADRGATEPAAPTVPPTNPASTPPAPRPAPIPARETSVLVFYATAGFVHESIPAGVAALQELGEEAGFTASVTADPSHFTPEGLADHDVVVFLNTTGDVLDADQEAAMEAFIGAGNGYVGIHSAADTEYDWTWYGGLIGAYFTGHPEPQTATIRVVDPSHPATAALPPEFERFDEWYNFADLPDHVDVLAVLDERTYRGGTMGDPHPIAWAHEFDGGRAFYTGFGHTSEGFSEPEVRTMLSGAIRWAAGPTG